jgi:hypothetical protein
MEPNDSERRARRAAEFLIYLDDLGFAGLLKADRRKFESLANNCYAAHKGQTQQLCALVNDLRDKGILDKIFQDNFKDRRSRQLADWVEEHDEADRRRAEAEYVQDRRDKIDVIVNKLEKLDDNALDQIKIILLGQK